CDGPLGAVRVETARRGATRRHRGSCCRGVIGRQKFNARAGEFDDVDAVEIFTPSSNMMPELNEPTAQVQCIITEGGKTANVVPDEATAQLTFRGASRQSVNQEITYTSPIPKSIKEPLGFTDEVRTFGTRVLLNDAILNSQDDHASIRIPTAMVIATLIMRKPNNSANYCLIYGDKG
ncbi:MAG: hypothetical protein ACR2RV_01850, partial [Verrucomicrobiales bacterium]